MELSTQPAAESLQHRDGHHDETSLLAKEEQNMGRVWVEEWLFLHGNVQKKNNSIARQAS